MRFLANRGPHIHFALLTDFLDAAQQAMPSDQELLELARQRIAELNATYADPAGGEDRFFLLHRPRAWNARERAWMGRERKRGKLADLNAMLRTGDASAFSVVEGDTQPLGNVRYVITLDTDTQLPRDAALEFVATLAHPLNRARWDESSGRVVSGYGILQPRVGVSLSGTQRSRYARWFGSEPGIDPYTRAVSDVYQDLFGEGSFIGKGIYDVETFERALAGRFPDNAILSHDLLEGCYARSGLMSDTQLYEDYPARYAADVARRHRWIRGDWQLLPWLLPRVRLEAGSRERNPRPRCRAGNYSTTCAAASSPAAMLALFAIGWSSFDTALRWTLCIVRIAAARPAGRAHGRPAAQVRRAAPVDASARRTAHGASRHGARVLLHLACLPYEAWFSIDAIVRTLWRMFVTRRHLLQWKPSSEVERTQRDDPVEAYRTMWFAPALAIALAAWIAYAHPGTLPIAAPILGLWLLAPALAWWISRAPKRRIAELDNGQLQFLGRLSRRTWAFFETHVGADDHWLPPDNVQEHPVRVVAHRTSPTNIGLSLLADLSALDFGYITTGAFLERSNTTLDDACDTGSPPRPFLQLVRHANAQAVAAALCLDRGQRQPRRAFACARRRLARAGRRAGPASAHFDGIADTLRRAGRDPPRTRCQRPIAARRCAGSNAHAASSGSVRTHMPHCNDLQAMPHAFAKGCLPTDRRRTGRSGCSISARARSRIWPGARPGWPRRRGSKRSVPRVASPRCPACAGSRARRSMRIGEHADLSAGMQTRPPPQITAKHAMERIAELDRLAHLARELADMEYDFLYDRARHLLSIGYNVDERRLDDSHYDLLASEARLCNFVAIAQGELPQESWFALGRQLTSTGGEPLLMSWSGSMFEYLMPQIVMPNLEGTLLDATMHAAVERQIEYGRQRGVPWGVSESGYNTLDAQLNYQYRAFGVPGLGLKRGLAQDLVIAPYASALALMVEPEEACANLQRLTEAGYAGTFGLYEAIDLTPSRLPRGHLAAVIRSFMAHHQGMSLLSLAFVLLDRPMQRRFNANRNFQATLLLLQERVPRTAVIPPHIAESFGTGGNVDTTETRLRVFNNPDTAIPAVQMLSNGRYNLMVTSAGGGYSRRQDIAVTRWEEDATADALGSFCYLRDLDKGRYWSAAHQPTRTPVDGYEAIFSDARAEFRVRERDFDAHTEIVVSPEDDIELRRTRITNRSRTRRTIELTSYAEVVLATAASDAAHPAFSNLFVQTELLRPKQAILCNRRPQAEHDRSPWMFHLVAVHGADIQAISYETDRARFIGRGRDLAHPQAMDVPALSDTDGSVLDPVVAIRVRVVLEPDQAIVVDYVSGVGDSRDACLGLIGKYRDRHLADRVFDLAWTHSQVVRRQLNASQSDAQLYERLAGSILHANPALRAEASVLIKNRRGQSGLWGYSISGDLPIVLLQIADPARIELVRQVVQAHAYWRLKGLAVDLVIWNEDRAGYRQELQDAIMGLIAAGPEASTIDEVRWHFSLRAAQQMSTPKTASCSSPVARIVLSGQAIPAARSPSRSCAAGRPRHCHRNMSRARSCTSLHRRSHSKRSRCSATTASVVYPKTAANTSSTCKPGRRLPRPGATCWPIRGSAAC